MELSLSPLKYLHGEDTRQYCQFTRDHQNAKEQGGSGGLWLEKAREGGADHNNELNIGRKGLRNS